MPALLEAEVLPELLPLPPEDLREEVEKIDARFAPAPDLAKWVRTHFIDEDGAFFNSEHEHLQQATIGFVWTNGVNRRHMMPIVGQAEVLQPPKNWGDARGSYLLRQWFGIEPDFLITIFAPYLVEQALDQNFAAVGALLDHELYHCGQAQDRDGLPKFTKDGGPKFGLRGHDVEEFVGVVRRWGVNAAAGQTRALVQAAGRPTLFDEDTWERSCRAVCGCGAPV